MLVVVLSACTLSAGSSPETSPAPSTTDGTPVMIAPSTETSVTASTTTPLKGVVVVIDPGHNGANAAHPEIINKVVYAGYGLTKPCNTTGTATSSSYSEHAHNWDVAVRLRTKLQTLGATVVLTRPDDKGVGPCINTRAHIGNVEHATVVISIHADGNLTASARGFHVIVAPKMYGGSAVVASSKKLAGIVRDDFQRTTGMPRSNYTGAGTGLTVRSDLGGLNLSYRVAVMLEAGNMRNATDAKLLTSSSFRDKEAAALVSAVRHYLGK